MYYNGWKKSVVGLTLLKHNQDHLIDLRESCRFCGPLPFALRVKTKNKIELFLAYPAGTSENGCTQLNSPTRLATSEFEIHATNALVWTSVISFAGFQSVNSIPVLAETRIR